MRPNRDLSALKMIALHTNRDAYATMLCTSVVSLSVICDICIVTKRCVLEQKLLLIPYRKSYMRGIDWYRNK